jgi:hypothetical protein
MHLVGASTGSQVFLPIGSVFFLTFKDSLATILPPAVHPCAHNQNHHQRRRDKLISISRGNTNPQLRKDVYVYSVRCNCSLHPAHRGNVIEKK